MVRMRKLLGGATAAALLVAWAFPATAHATVVHPWVPYYEVTSDTDGTARKQATVTCPDGKLVHGMGGRIVRGEGRVALIGIMPSLDMTSVTATGLARPGYTGTWAVAVSAVCLTPWGEGPQRVTQTGRDGGAVAACTGQRKVFASGFLLDDPNNAWYVSAVVPSPTLTWLSVQTAGGTTPPRLLVAAAVCGSPVAASERDEATVAMAPAGPTAGEADVTLFGSYAFGAGVRADRAGLFIDELGPTPNLSAARARMAASVPIKGMAMTTTDDEMTVYASSIGSWYDYPS